MHALDMAYVNEQLGIANVIPDTTALDATQKFLTRARENALLLTGYATMPLGAAVAMMATKGLTVV